MNSVTQDMKFRQSLLKYSQKYGVTKAAIKYKTNRHFLKCSLIEILKANKPMKKSPTYFHAYLSKLGLNA